MSAQARLSFPNGLSFCGEVIQIVPWGRRLFVDSISFQGVSLGGQGLLKVTTMVAGQVKSYVIPAIRKNPVFAPEVVSGAAAIDLVADPGTAVLVTFHRSFDASKSGATLVAVSLAGRYAEL